MLCLNTRCSLLARLVCEIWYKRLRLILFSIVLYNADKSPQLLFAYNNSGKSGGLLLPSPLRTVQASFPAYGSSTSNLFTWNRQQRQTNWLWNALVDDKRGATARDCQKQFFRQDTLVRYDAYSSLFVV